jgi:hypothetical protein
MSYCAAAAGHPDHGPYHDTEHSPSCPVYAKILRLDPPWATAAR